MRGFVSPKRLGMRGDAMKDPNKAGLGELVTVADAKNSSNVVRVELFQSKKKEEEYKKALDRVLLRAQKSDW